MTSLKLNRWAVRSALALLTIAGILTVRAAQTGAQSGSSEGAFAPGTGGIDPILVGTIDLHAHQGPDDKARSSDFLEAAQYARMKGMRGLVLKSHYDSTAIQAFMVRKYVPGFEAFGTIDLNRTHGGMNPFDVAGGHTLRWTGMDIRKKDGSPHHGVGIKPTVPVSRTLAGVIAGRDELLEKAIEVVSHP